MNLSITGPLDDHVFLVGRPPINEFLGFVAASEVAGVSVKHGALVNEWRAANQHVERLMKEEAGLSDGAQVDPLPEAMREVELEARRSDEFVRAYQNFPVEVGLVELDKLVVYQKHINLAYVANLRALLGDQPSDTKIARVALGLDRNDPGVAVSQIGPNAYSFMSSSNDFRFLAPRMYQPADVKNDFSTGPVSHVLGLALGYSANCLSAISIGGRLILFNGSHRAYSLRGMGMTRAPCVVLKVGNRDELELLGIAEVSQHPDRYLDSPRPPLLKDYFDGALRKVVKIARKNRVVRLQFVYDQTDMPAA